MNTQREELMESVVPPCVGTGLFTHPASVGSDVITPRAQASWKSMSEGGTKHEKESWSDVMDSWQRGGKCLLVQFSSTVKSETGTTVTPDLSFHFICAFLMCFLQS